MGDLGVQATYDILDDLKQKVKEQHIKEPSECRQILIDSIKEQMDVGETAYEFENKTSVVMVIGVNGVGKTTTIGKLAGKLKESGKKGHPGRGRYLPCSRWRAAKGMGRTRAGVETDRRHRRALIRRQSCMMR